MVVADLGKLVILTVLAVGLMLGLVFGAFEGDSQFAAWGLLGTIVGYVTGNGAAAVRKQAPSATITVSQQRMDDNGPNG